MSETERLLREMRASIKALEEERDRLRTEQPVESGSVFTEEELRLIRCNSSSVRESTETVDPLQKIGEALYHQAPPHMRTAKDARRLGRLHGLVAGFAFGSWIGGLLFPDDK